MTGHLARLHAYRGLLWNLALAEMKARHRQTALGMVWALAQPISMMVVMTAVFSIFVKLPVEGAPYFLFAYTGVLTWLLLANTVSNGLPSIVANMSLVTKASFPREVIPLSKLLVSGFDFFVGLCLLAGFMVVFDVPFSTALLVVPAIVVIQILLIIGVLLFCSALYVLYRDLGALLPLALQLGMLLSPVVYPVSVIPKEYQAIYMLNPMATLIEAYRSIILFAVVPGFDSLIVVFVMALAVCGGGYHYFKSVERRFADVM
jgi:lipopolysaccharide transport system permease protein